MGVTINSNIAAMRAATALSRTSEGLSSTFQRLSSGMRINRASDDAAGLAIADSLHADERVSRQGLRNLNDGLSLLGIADGAIEQLTNVVVRIRELSEQAANGPLGSSQRAALDEEAQALAAEYFRISKSTSFNGFELLDGSLGNLRLQAGFGLDGGIESGLGGAIGTGTFGAAMSYYTHASTPFELAIGDVNGDGLTDVVVNGRSAAPAQGYVSILLSTGIGTFQPAYSYNTQSSGSFGAVLGDLNNDGDLDLLTAGSGGAAGYMTVRLGNGDGSFCASVSYAGPATSYGTALYDVNNDGNLDALTVGNNATEGYAMVRLGRGDGTLGSAATYAAESTFSFNLTLADLNADGNLDMVSSGRGDVNTAYNTVRLGQGDGTFASAVSYLAYGRTSYETLTRDINGDSVLDMISAVVGTTEGVLAVRLGIGDGTFDALMTYVQPETGGCSSLDLGDVNGDGILDVVTGGYLDGLTGKASVRLGNADGTFGAAVSYDTEGNATQAGLALADFNGDGVLDLVTAGTGEATDGWATVRLGESRSGVAPLLPFSLRSMSHARQAMGALDAKLRQLSEQRGVIGAFQSRIATALQTIQVTAENYASAESRIRDTDVAADAAELIRQQILQQAGAGVLAQANQQPALALVLLSR